MSELEEFEEALKANLDSFQRRSEQTFPTKSKPRTPTGTSTTPAPAKTKKKPSDRWQPQERPVHIITLRVQKKAIALPEFYKFESPKLSKIEAERDARKAANAAGYPVISFVEDWQTL